jgi:hypothetical protein
MGFGKIGIKLNGLLREPVGAIKCIRTEIVAIQAVDPNGKVRTRQDGKGAGIVWIDGKRPLQQTTRLVKIVHPVRRVERT